MKNLNKIRGKREFHFDDKELIALGVCSLLLILLTLWLGILIGKGGQLQEMATVEEDSPIALSTSDSPSTVQPTSTSSEEKPKEEGGSKHTMLPQPDESKRDLKLSYYKVLQDAEQQGTYQPEVSSNLPSGRLETKGSDEVPALEVGKKEEVSKEEPNMMAEPELRASNTLPGVPFRQRGSPLRNTLESPSIIYSIQVVSSPSREESETLRNHLREKGYDAAIIPVNLGAQGVWYRVRVGSLTDRTEAERLKKELQERFTFVAKNPLIVKVSD